MREFDSLLRSRVSGCHATLPRKTMSLLVKLKLEIRFNLFWRHRYAQNLSKHCSRE